MPEEEELIYAKACRNEKYGHNNLLFVSGKRRVVPQGLLVNIIIFERYCLTQIPGSWRLLGKVNHKERMPHFVAELLMEYWFSLVRKPRSGLVWKNFQPVPVETTA